LKCDEMLIIGGVGLTLPGEFWIGDITGSNVLIGEGFGEGQLVGNKFGFALKPPSQQSQAIGRNVIERTLTQFEEDAVLQIGELFGTRTLGGADGLMGDFVLDGRLVCEAVGEFATPYYEGARGDVELGGDFGVGNAPRAQSDELLDNFRIFSVHKFVIRMWLGERQ